MTSNVPNTSVEELHKASKVHEANLVIELGIDRMVTWVGVYFIFILGFLMEVEQLFESGRGLACFAENSVKCFSKSEAELASFNCWEITSTANYANHCLQRNSTYDNQADYTRLDSVKNIVKLLPLLMIFMAFLTSLSPVWWHFNFGSRLLAHLKLIQFLLDKICEAISKIKKVKYNSRPYDLNSSHFIGKMPFRNPCIELALLQMSKTSDWLMTLGRTSAFETIQDVYNLLQIPIAVTKARNKKCINAQKIVCKIHEEFSNYAVEFSDRYTFREKYVKMCIKSKRFLQEKDLSGEILKWVGELKPSISNREIFDSQRTRDKFTETLPKKIKKVKKMLLENQDVEMELDSDTIRATFIDLEKKIETLTNIEKGYARLYNCICLLSDKAFEPKENELRDRHFLSLICYENFASLYYIPYIHLVFRNYGLLQKSERIIDTEEINIAGKLNETEIFAKTIPTVEATLRSWCHPKNLTACELLSNYRRKQIFTIFVAFLGFLIFGSLLVIIRILLNDNSQNLHCALPHICLVCSLLRETRLYILIGTACLSYVIVFCMLCHQLVNFNKRIQTNDCHLFELLQDLSMDGLIEEPNPIFASDLSSLSFDTDDETIEISSQFPNELSSETGDTANNEEEKAATTSADFQKSGKSSFYRAHQPEEKVNEKKTIDSLHLNRVKTEPMLSLKTLNQKKISISHEKLHQPAADDNDVRHSRTKETSFSYDWVEEEKKPLFSI